MLRQSLAATASVKFARRESANGGTSMDGLHPRSRAPAVMPSAECVGCHGPEELRHQKLRPANVVSEWLAMDTRLIGVEVHEPQLLLVGYAHVCSPRGIRLQLSRSVAFALQRHWRHVVRWW